ncbi:MAG: sensor histidine kinase N-terminal domain-containing protein [Planctomycetota bacterium]|nr:sensor histidine kinase N-terminal domain-containing protein [Planctomycetota bacterium]
MKPLPLKWRISLLVIVVLVAVITTISAVAYYELRESLLSNIDRTLRAMAGGVLADLEEFHDARELQNEIHSLMKGAGNEETARYRVWLDGKASDLIAGDPPASKYGRRLRELPVSDRPELGRQVFFNMRREKEEYRAIWMRRPNSRGNVNIVVAYSSHHAYHEMSEFLKMLVILGGSIVAGSTIAAILIVHWGLRPIGHAAARTCRQQICKAITRHWFSCSVTCWITQSRMAQSGVRYAYRSVIQAAPG